MLPEEKLKSEVNLARSSNASDAFAYTWVFWRVRRTVFQFESSSSVIPVPPRLSLINPPLRFDFITVPVGGRLLHDWLSHTPS